MIKMIVFICSTCKMDNITIRENAKSDPFNLLEEETESLTEAMSHVMAGHNVMVEYREVE